MLTILCVVAFLAVVNAKCDNSCSGHGTCNTNSKCTCYDNWGLGLSHDSGDCSQRICPYDFAWVDKPSKIGAHHRYAECSEAGICNRESGECECFPGFAGKACQRAECPNSCSGHGLCKYIEDLGYGVVPEDMNSAHTYKTTLSTMSYYTWDITKSRACVCDPEYGDVDCSKRMCNYGTDVMDTRDDMLAPAVYQTQHIKLFPAIHTHNYPRSFALTFTSKLNETFTTRPIVFDSTMFGSSSTYVNEFVLDVQQALLELPNRVIDKLIVQAHVQDFLNGAANGYLSYQGLYLNITFTGAHVQGPQHLITVRDYLCGDGCTPKITGLYLIPFDQNVTEILTSDFNSYECGRRGKCDYTTGVCNCFAGYTGLACNTITALV